MKISRIQVKWALLLCSASAYIISLFLPALLLENDTSIKGSSVLTWGWWGVMMYEFAWLANPAFIIAIWTYIIANLDNSKGFSIIALIFSVLAPLFGSTSFHAKAWPINEWQSTPIIGLGAGFYVWMLGFGILLIDYFISPRAYSARDI